MVYAEWSNWWSVCCSSMMANTYVAHAWKVSTREAATGESLPEASWPVRLDEVSCSRFNERPRLKTIRYRITEKDGRTYISTCTYIPTNTHTCIQERDIKEIEKRDKQELLKVTPRSPGCGLAGRVLDCWLYKEPWVNQYSAPHTIGVLVHFCSPTTREVGAGGMGPVHPSQWHGEFEVSLMYMKPYIKIAIITECIW